MTSLKTSIKTITYLSDTGCLEIQGASLQGMLTDLLFIALIQQDLELAPERIRHSEALVKKLV
ncbi:RpiR-family transcriptional regulator [Escherichia coli]|nr:RpiR-family transcriptional regulator [Escherichia coli]